MATQTQWEYEAAVARIRHRLSPTALAAVDDLLRPWIAVTTTPQARIQYGLQEALDDTLWEALWQAPEEHQRPERHN